MNRVIIRAYGLTIDKAVEIVGRVGVDNMPNNKEPQEHRHRCLEAKEYRQWKGNGDRMTRAVVFDSESPDIIELRKEFKEKFGSTEVLSYGKEK